MSVGQHLSMLRIVFCRCGSKSCMLRPHLRSCSPRALLVQMGLDQHQVVPVGLHHTSRLPSLTCGLCRIYDCILYIMPGRVQSTNHSLHWKHEPTWCMGDCRTPACRVQCLRVEPSITSVRTPESS